MAPQGTLKFVRRYTRINVELIAAFSMAAPTEEAPRNKSVLIKNLGVGGIMFLSPICLKEGMLVEMTVCLDFSVIPFTAEVAWIEIKVEREEKGFRCGLKFRSISDDDLSYIHDFLHKQLQINPNSAG
jgi:hypothetical protein